MGFDTRGKIEYRHVDRDNIYGQEVSVLVNFNPEGRMKPVYVQIEDPLEGKVSLQVEEVVSQKDVSYAACEYRIFIADLRRNGQLIRTQIVFQKDTFVWRIGSFH